MASRRDRTTRERLRDVKHKAAGGGYGSEEELRIDLIAIIKEILLRLGVPPQVDAERRLIRGRPDARVGGLLYEFEEPPDREGPFTRSKVPQLQGYIQEIWSRDAIHAQGIASNGYEIVLLDDSGHVVDSGDIVDKAWAFEAWVTVAGLKVVQPQDLLSRIGPRTPLGRDFIETLYRQFEDNRERIPFVRDSFEAWMGVYGNAVNLSPDVVEAVRKYARDAFGFPLAGKPDVERFLFVSETYLAILLKLLVARTLLQKLLVQPHTTVSELLGADRSDGFARLAERVPSVRNAFEADLFTWFVDVCRHDREAARAIDQKLGDLAGVLDTLDFGQVSVDLLRELYQDFFEPALRIALGEFYTTEEIVDEVLDAAGFSGAAVESWARGALSPEGTFVLDPACGSGTFLIRVIERLKQTTLSREEKLRVAAQRIVGFDIHPFAVAMARSNFILVVSDLYSTSDNEPLGIPIYWADSLAKSVEERKLGGGGEGAHSVFRLPIPVLGEFHLPDPREIPWGELLETVRRAVDSPWTKDAFLQEVRGRYRELAGVYEEQLLKLFQFFQKRKRDGLDGRWISLVANVSTVESIRGRCALVCGNPPWVRIHNIRKEVRDRLSTSYLFYRKTELGWDPEYRATKLPFRALPDYSMAFVEAGMGFLKTEGTLGFVITSKIEQALYSNLLRKALTSQFDLCRMIDYSLSPRRLFKDAVNYPLVLAVRNRPYIGSTEVKVVNAVGHHKSWRTTDLSLRVGDPESPWALAPLEVHRVFRTMQEGRPRFGDVSNLQVGILTQADKIYYIEEIADTTTAGVKLCKMRSGEEVRLDAKNIRPIVEGTDVREWLCTPSRWVLWTHDDTGRCLERLPPATMEYVSREDIRRKLRNRSEFKTLSRRPNPPKEWEIFRVDERRLGPKVLWRDLSTRMEAAFVPRTVQDPNLGSTILIPAHTTYVASVPDEQSGRALAGLLNSVPVRAFLKSYAERARGGYYRHFSGAVGSVPLPLAIATALNGVGSASRTRRTLAPFVRLASQIQGAMQEGRTLDDEQVRLDELVAQAYGLDRSQVELLTEYDAFMRTVPQEERDADTEEEEDT